MEFSIAFDNKSQSTLSQGSGSRVIELKWASGKPVSELFFKRSANGAGSAVISSRYYLKPSAVRSEGDGLSASESESVAKFGKIIDVAQIKFVELARFEHFEYGYTQSSERHLLKFASDHPRLVGELVQNIYLAEMNNAKIILALLNAVASLGYETVRPHGQVLAIAALSNPVAEVKEAAIRVYEEWGHAEGAEILAGVDCPWAWLDDYRKQVISDLGGNA